MGMEKFLVVINCDSLNDFSREDAHILLILNPRGVEPPDNAPDDEQHDQEQRQPSLASRACRGRQLHLEAETGPFNDVAVTNESSMFLFAREKPPRISGANFELHQITTETGPIKAR